MTAEKVEKVPFAPFLPFLVLISFTSFLNLLARMIFPPMTPYICDEMHLCHTDMGNLFFILSIGFAITLFLSQFLSSKISHKMTVIFSIFMTGFALVMTSHSNDFQFFRLFVFVVGLCSGFFIPSAIAMMRESVVREHMGKAFGIFSTAQSVAFILGPMIVKHLIAVFTWREILNGFGFALSSISVFLFFLFKRGNTKGHPISVSFVRNVFSWPSFWILLFFLCVANGLNIGVYSMAPDYFQRHNFLDKEIVYKLIVLARVSSIFTAIFAGFVVDLFGLKRSMVISFALCGALTMLIGMGSPSSALVLFTIQSPIAACLMPLIHLAISTIVPSDKNAAIVSIIAPFGFLTGAGIVPQLLGFFGDFNIYAQGFVFFGFISLISGAIFNVNAIYRHVEYSQMKSSPEV